MHGAKKAISNGAISQIATITLFSFLLKAAYPTKVSCTGQEPREKSVLQG